MAKPWMTYYEKCVDKKDNDYGMLMLERMAKGSACGVITIIEMVVKLIGSIASHVYWLGIIGAIAALVFMLSDVRVTDGPQFLLGGSLLALSPFICQAACKGLEYLDTILVVPNDEEIEEMRKSINGEPNALD